MNNLLRGMLLVTLGLFSSSLLAAPGEWWEVKAKMEMEGMPFAMPAQTTKVCMPKGGQSDPKNTQGKDSNCKMTDVKHSGNTVKFKGTCVNQGETMNMAGETSHDANSFKSNVKMTGKSDGENVNMAMVSSGKRIGGACDTEEMGRKAKAQMDAGLAAACDTSKYTTRDWVASSSLFIGAKPACVGKKDAFCKVLRNDVPHDKQAYETLKYQEREKGSASAVKACNLNIESIRGTLCRENAKRGPLQFLEANCPAEAKAYRELLRKREECEGRGFTGANFASLMKQCMGGQIVEDEAGTRPAKSRKIRADADSEDSGSSDATSDAMKEGTKALKGLFGF